MYSYFESLSFFESCELAFFIFGFSMIVRYGFRYADWTLKVYKDFFSRFKSPRP